MGWTRLHQVFLEKDMTAYPKLRNLILAAASAAILLYFSTLAAKVYVVILVAAAVIFRLTAGNAAARMENFLTNAVTLIGACLLLAVLLEIGLHLAPHFIMRDNGPDTLGEFSDFTSRGYLTEEVFKKPPEVFRILSLGDSFAVYAPNNNEKHNYHGFLREKFIASGREKLEIVNAGMPAIGPGYYGRILEKLGDRFQPDLVLVGFFVGNDFLEWEFYISLGDFLMEPQRGFLQKFLRYRQFNHWRLYQVSYRKLVWYRERKRMQEEVNNNNKVTQDQGSFSAETFLEIEMNRSVFFMKDRRRLLEHHWAQCAGILTQMKQWCKARNLPLALVIFPDQFQVDRQLRAEVCQKYHLDEANLDLEYPNTLIENFCRQNDIPCLDLLGTFREQGKTATLYVLRDTHWNEAGNRLAAETIFNFLQDRNLLKAR